jgi:hypothetical protein
VVRLLGMCWAVGQLIIKITSINSLLVFKISSV